MFVRKSRENYRQIYMIYGKSKARLWRNLSTGMPPKFFRTILCIVALLYNWYFFRTAVLLKLSDIRFSYKHCNVSRVCLLVKMASKTVTRSIIKLFVVWQNSRHDAFNRTKPDRIVKRKMPVTDPQHQTYTVKSRMHLFARRRSRLVHVADAVENFHYSTMIRNLALFLLRSPPPRPPPPPTILELLQG